MELSRDGLEDVIHAAKRDRSFDSPFGYEDDRTLYDVFGGDGFTELVDRAIDYDILRRKIEKLGERDAYILTRYYGLDGNEPAILEEIGEDLGLTRERVRQLRDRAVGKIRESIESYQV